MGTDWKGMMTTARHSIQPPQGMSLVGVGEVLLLSTEKEFGAEIKKMKDSFFWIKMASMPIIQEVRILSLILESCSPCLCLAQ